MGVRAENSLLDPHTTLSRRHWLQPAIRIHSHVDEIVLSSHGYLRTPTPLPLKGSSSNSEVRLNSILGFQQSLLGNPRRKIAVPRPEGVQHTLEAMTQAYGNDSKGATTLFGKILVE